MVGTYEHVLWFIHCNYNELSMDCDVCFSTDLSNIKDLNHKQCSISRGTKQQCSQKFREEPATSQTAKPH